MDISHLGKPQLPETFLILAQLFSKFGILFTSTQFHSSFTFRQQLLLTHN